MSNDTPKPERFMRAREVVDRVGLSRASVYRQVDLGTFPAPIKISERSVAWRESEVDAWMGALIEGAA
ncbi:AlpA family phage regulatory protein [Sedimentitalea sp.]|uniref:helix-turn-helix transcriptional regulator n=1 Tax=Sedimentitalea sp. TaxID=2048915 RepID=UPI003296D905